MSKINNNTNKHTHSILSPYNHIIYLNNHLKYPELIIFYNNQIINNDLLKLKFKKILIIENIEPFYEFKKVLKLLNLNENFDILYGSGKQITNSNFFKFLNTYESIYIFGDIDKGGFDIYLSLKVSLSVSVKKLYPKNIERYFKLIERDNFQENIYNFKSGFEKKDMRYVFMTTYKDKKLSEEDKQILLLIDKYQIGIEEEKLLNIFTNDFIKTFN